MAFLENAWYVAAWGDEIGRKLFSRRIIGESVLLFRKQNGEAVAIGNVCPHRFAPLDMGRLIGDTVECPYHGLRFDQSGACVLAARDGALPTKVRKFPLVERYGCVWVWMGDERRADPATIPGFDYLLDDTRRQVRGEPLLVNANYKLIIDNLLDLTHVQFVHREFHQIEAFSRGTHEVVRDGSTIYSKFWFPNGKAPFLAKHLPDPETIVDHWAEMRWDAPSLMFLDSGVTPTGRPRSEGITMYGTHLLTPETETTTHYFFVNSRDFKVADTEVDQGIREWQRVGFGLQDKPLIEAIQRTMGATADLTSFKPVWLASDAPAARVRQMLTNSINREHAASTENAA